MVSFFPRKKLLQTPHSTWQSSSTLPGVFDLHPGMSFQSFLQYPQLWPLDMMVLLIYRMKVDECSYILKMDVENSREIRITQTVLNFLGSHKYYEASVSIHVPGSQCMWHLSLYNRHPWLLGHGFFGAHGAPHFSEIILILRKIFIIFIVYL